jgi:hypothetical protein
MQADDQLPILDRFEHLGPKEEDSSTVVRVQGQICHKRCFGRKLFFIDVTLLNKDAGGVLEAIIKPNNQLVAEEVRRLRYELSIGDVVEMSGKVERLENSHLMLRCHTLTVIQQVSAMSPEKATAARSSGAKLPDASRGVVEPKSSDPSAPKKVCKFWINEGQCFKGDQCPNVHCSAAEMKAERLKWVAERRLEKATKSKLAEDPFDPHSKQLKAKRATVFCEWLIARFGSSYLASSTGVMDIAGGRGDISFELQNKHGIRCTLIEPRKRKLSKAQRKYLAAGTADGAAREDRVHQVETMFMFDRAQLSGGGLGSGKGRASASDVQAKGDTNEDGDSDEDMDDIVGSDGGFCDAQKRIEFQQQQRQQRRQQRRERRRQEQQLQPSSTTPASTNLRLPNLFLDKQEQVSSLLQSCSLAVGMHPDQATEPIIDAALQSGKPFAVVPCCVFTRQFAGRRLLKRPAPLLAGAAGLDELGKRAALAAVQRSNQGREEIRMSLGMGSSSASAVIPPIGRRGDGEEGAKEVVTYEDFLLYLRAKHPDIHIEFLPFRGRNAVLWYVPTPELVAAVVSRAAAAAAAAAATKADAVVAGNSRSSSSTTAGGEGSTSHHQASHLQRRGTGRKVSAAASPSSGLCGLKLACV